MARLEPGRRLLQGEATADAQVIHRLAVGEAHRAAQHYLEFAESLTLGA